MRWKKGRLVSPFDTDSPDGSRYVERILTVVTSLTLQGGSREVLNWLIQARMDGKDEW